MNEAEQTLLRIVSRLYQHDAASMALESRVVEMIERLQASVAPEKRAGAIAVVEHQHAEIIREIRAAFVASGHGTLTVTSRMNFLGLLIHGAFDAGVALARGEA